MTDQLAFQFSNMPTTATTKLILFPASRLRVRLRETAAFVLRKPSAKRAWHFRNQVGRIWDEAQRQGLSNELAGAQMRDFATALESEMRRQVVMSILTNQRGGAA